MNMRFSFILAWFVNMPRAKQIAFLAMWILCNTTANKAFKVLQWVTIRRCKDWSKITISLLISIILNDIDLFQSFCIVSRAECCVNVFMRDKCFESLINRINTEIACTSKWFKINKLSLNNNPSNSFLSLSILSKMQKTSHVCYYKFKVVCANCSYF